MGTTDCLELIRVRWRLFCAAMKLGCLSVTTTGDCRIGDGRGSEQGDSTSLHAIIGELPKHQVSQPLAKMSLCRWADYTKIWIWTINITSSLIPADDGEIRRTPNSDCTTIFCRERYVLGVWAALYRCLFSVIADERFHRDFHGQGKCLEPTQSMKSNVPKPS